MPGINEVSAKIIDSWLDGWLDEFNKLSAEERAYKVICSYFRLENPDDDMCGRFLGWFMDERNRLEKDRAMERIFIEVLNYSGRLETSNMEICA